jgi:hypothetical protein
VIKMGRISRPSSSLLFGRGGWTALTGVLTETGFFHTFPISKKISGEELGEKAEQRYVNDLWLLIGILYLYKHLIYIYIYIYIQIHMVLQNTIYIVFPWDKLVYPLV